MLSATPPVQRSNTPAPNLISRRWWKRNTVVITVGVVVLAVLVGGIIMGSSRLLFLFPKKKTPTPFVPPSEPVIPTPIPPEKVIGDVIVPKEVGEDNFYLKPTEFETHGMGAQSEIVITSKVDMDTEAVLFHLVLDPVFAYDVVLANPREIRIKPKEPFAEKGLYHFRLSTSYKDGDTQVNRLYQWAYETNDALDLLQGTSKDQTAKLDQDILAQLGLYPQGTTNELPLNEDQYRGVMSLTPDDTIPFDRLPLSSNMDVFVLPQSIASLWGRILLHFQDRDGVNSIVSSHIVKSFFDHAGVGTFDVAEPTPTASYSDSDLSITELLALIAYADPTWLSPEMLKSYFRSIYSSLDATSSQRAQAAFGLASLGEPYIQEQVNLLNDPRLTPMDRLYLGLGLDRMGATEYTVLIYRDTLKDYKTQGPTGSMIHISQSSVRDQYATLLTALVGFTFDREDPDLKSYLDSQYGGNGTFLHTLYMTQRAAREAIPSQIFQMVFGGTSKTFTLDDTHRMVGTAMTTPILKTLKIEGNRAGLRLLIAY